MFVFLYIINHFVLQKIFLTLVLDNSPLLSSFHVMLLEHIIMCRLVTGNKTLAIQEVNFSVLCRYSSFHKFLLSSNLSYFFFWVSFLDFTSLLYLSSECKVAFCSQFSVTHFIGRKFASKVYSIY